MEVLVNGETKQVSSGTLQSLLQELAFEGDFAVAVNSEFVPRSLYSEQVIQSGDQIDVLSPIAGG
ncbi:sulfur carrier protein ThiS [Litoribrevibacter euphylliae]|uniref:Sulfur carrier protein ThiS n=1 Tax=Litoribrevibacter euphylliae TaxID=1834034 RepID=A0ABV7HG22_9GAMM